VAAARRRIGSGRGALFGRCGYARGWRTEAARGRGAVSTSFTSSAAVAPGAGGRSRALVHDVQIAFAHSTQTLFHIMAGVLAATFVFAFLSMPRGRVETAAEEPATSGDFAFPAGGAS
jgi:hypothetical protein